MDFLFDIYRRALHILSHELMMRSNDTDVNWFKGALLKALYEKWKDDFNGK